jgi:hypothetical protein
MAQGCNQTTAVNFAPNATSWDHSCIYLMKLSFPNSNSQTEYCLAFEDLALENTVDKSFTMSYSVKDGAWVFFHDYIPDFYFHTREALFALKDNALYKTNAGPVGKYFTDTVNPFFIDVVFKADGELLLETVNWVSSVLEDSSDASTVGSEWNTLTHISIWNSQQHSGKISLQDVFADLQYQTSRKTDGKWSFNDFRNIVTDRGTTFIKDLFNNYRLDPAMASTKDWYEAELLQDKYFVIRFEFDNLQKKQLILHDTTVQAQKALR